MKKPRYKQIILDETQIDQLGSYLQIAVNNLADHSVRDGIELLNYFHSEIDKQKWSFKKELKKNNRN